MPDGNAPMSFGERVEYYRLRAGMTRPVLGQLCGRSAEWVKAIETGRLLMPRLPLLIRMSEVLEVDDLAELTGEQKLTSATYGKRRHEQADRIARVLATFPLEASGDREPVTAEALAGNVAQAWIVWHGSPQHRTAVATVLPRLLADAHYSAKHLEGNERRRALVSLAQVYHLAQLYLSFQPIPNLVMLTGDRAMRAAQDADDPTAIAAAAWYMNHVYRDAGEQAEARIELAHQASALLDQERDEERALWGLLQLAIALSHAKTGRRGDAERHWDQADRAARSLEGRHPWLLFGQDMVNAYAVTMYADLTDATEATKQANRINIEMPSATRRSFHTIEIARAYHLKREPLATVHLLNRAFDIAPETVSYNLFTRAAVLELMASGGATVRDDARALGRKLQLPDVA
ncbi:transcriptional regulator with XRE-family HTH domain [Thermocatellispora tengchongensis]|uniref:Transcriptional regulator with XRE-family HTH domain n=1 Tax=Thermocatellispora tengchongensis TaxID=1073253 RepID=A0A840P6M6_9ACTN|nr:helix-turn-helix transcriptional regulator [Thermocatellispora tengchongensis]MBB5134236.1 transcriptional regulator with XRE-family HTH domain [Thermocatellispora tengchongensis]